MTSTTFLDMQYSLSKRSFLRRPTKMFSRSRQNSGVMAQGRLDYQPSMYDLKQVFDRFDSNRDGKISPEEYKAILRSMGKTMLLTREVQKIFEVADSDGDGYIDFNEFVEVQKKGGGMKMMDLQTAFKTFDKDGDGKISAGEVYELLQRLGEKCSLQDCREMVRAVDSNRDGVIDMDEFITMMTRTAKLC